jgi:hypothetical protein
VTEKIHDEPLLRSRTRALAKEVYERRWGALTHADAATLDVELWRESWKLGVDVEKRAQRHFAAITAAIEDAASFVQSCRETPRGQSPFPTTGLPMGHAAQVLEQCVPGLLRALESMDQKRARGVDINPAEPPERSTWIRHRLHVYFSGDDELRAAPRKELAAMAILAGWWPPKATGRKVSMVGMTEEHVLALEGDLIDRARKRILRQHEDLERDPALQRLAADLVQGLRDRKLKP